ncbi:hypothetical protein L1887_52906 [Cichorium endivia]|nr:hypothetical protein L1887_52906 [Cichorium endivia]
MRLTKKAGDKSSPVTSPTKSKGSKPEGLDRPTERQVEAKTEDGIGSVVRYLYFANAPIINQGQFQRTLWAGTNAGNVFIYLINDVKEEATSSPAAEAANKSTASDTAAASGNQTEEPAAAAAAEAAQASTANEKKDNEIEESPIDQDKSSPVNLTYKIVIETPEPEQPVAAGDQANQSEPAKEQLEEQQATGETPAEPATSNQQSAGQETNSVKPKNADNQTTPSLAKVTEVKTVDEKKPDASPKTKAAKKKEKKEEKKKEERVIDGIAATVPKTIEEPDCSVKLLETDRDLSNALLSLFLSPFSGRLCSSPVQLTAQPVLAELKPHSNGLKSGTNLMDVEVDVEVHHNGNGDLKELKNGHRSLADEDEGTGKSLAIDDEPKSEELHLESVKSNGTPTSGVVSIVDDDDPFSDAHDLNSPTLEHARTEVKLIETDAKHVDRHFEQFENNHTKSSKWSNLNEPRDSESANNSTIEHSFNLTAADTDITVDSIKEHFSNLHITNDVDLLGLDTNDGAGGKLFV